MKPEQKKEVKISRDVALEELTNFLKKHKSKEFRRGKMTPLKIEEDYIDVLEAIEDGLLVFNEHGVPVYELRTPLVDQAGNLDTAVKSVTFRQRIRESDKTRVMDGLDIEKQRGTYVLKLIGFITQLQKSDYDRLEKEDFDVLNQICSVF